MPYGISEYRPAEYVLQEEIAKNIYAVVKRHLRRDGGAFGTLAKRCSGGKVHSLRAIWCV